MFNREGPRLQEFSHISTRVQFLNIMSSFLENNDISQFGHSRMEIRRAGDTGVPTPSLCLSLTCEIR